MKLLLSNLNLDLYYNKSSEYHKNKIKVIENFCKKVIEFGEKILTNRFNETASPSHIIFLRD